MAASAYSGQSVLHNVAFGPRFCRNPSMPFFVVGEDADAAAQHDFDAVYGHVGRGMQPRPQWVILNYAKATTKENKGQRRAWYGNEDACLVRTDTLPCDEFPFFSSRQGSGFSVPQPSLRLINQPHNELEGTRLASMIKRCKLDSSGPITKTSNGTGGSPYLVLPMPAPGASDVPSLFWRPAPVASPITVGLCNQGDTGDGGPTAS